MAGEARGPAISGSKQPTRPRKEERDQVGWTVAVRRDGWRPRQPRPSLVAGERSSVFVSSMVIFTHFRP
ncbi:hypothetical protein NL676_007682 [Syzygium grande]|nr:hypothetical protein NL676_007682 [Syzygium grande]